MVWRMTCGAVADLLSLERPVIMGHSMGGIVTLTLLLAHPGFARKAVIVDIGPKLPDSHVEPSQGSQRIREFTRGAREFDSIDEFVDRVTEYDPSRSAAHVRRTSIYNLMQRSDGKFVSKGDSRGVFEGRATWPTLSEMAAIDCPVLVVRGGQSDILLQADAARFVAALPQGLLTTVPKCGHNVHSQNTAGFLDAITPFLEE